MKKENTEELRKQLYDYVDGWFDDMNIHCVETICQKDAVIVKAYEFLEEIFYIIRDGINEDEENDKHN